MIKKQEKNPGVLWLGWLGGLTTALGAFLLLRDVDDCGSVLAPDLFAAELADTLVGISGNRQECLESLDSAAVPAWIVFCLGIIFVIAAIVTSVLAKQTPEANRGDPTRPSTIADELDRLDSLRTRGVLNDAEFEQQKRLLLSERSSGD